LRAAVDSARSSDVSPGFHFWQGPCTTTSVIGDISQLTDLAEDPVIWV
jgi:hypothetical protein